MAIANAERDAKKSHGDGHYRSNISLIGIDSSCIGEPDIFDDHVTYTATKFPGAGSPPSEITLDNYIQNILSNFPGIDKVSIEGVFEYAENESDFDLSFDLEDVIQYNVSSWEVPFWTRADHLDKLVRKHSGFSSFSDLIDAKGDYRPTIATARMTGTQVGLELVTIANAYDAEQQARGDERRAYRS